MESIHVRAPTHLGLAEGDRLRARLHDLQGLGRVVQHHAGVVRHEVGRVGQHEGQRLRVRVVGHEGKAGAEGEVTEKEGMLETLLIDTATKQNMFIR